MSCIRHVYSSPLISSAEMPIRVLINLHPFVLPVFLCLSICHIVVYHVYYHETEVSKGSLY